MCSLSGCVYTCNRSWHSNVNRSVDELSNVAHDQIMIYIFDNSVCQNNSNWSIQDIISLTIFVISTNCAFPSAEKWPIKVSSQP